MNAQELKAIAKVVGDTKFQEIKNALKAVKKVTTNKERTPRVTIDSVTLGLLMDGKGHTKLQIVSEVSKTFPDKFANDATWKKSLSKETAAHLSPDDKQKVEARAVLYITTSRRLNGYLKNKYDVTIKKDDNGKYTIVTKKNRRTTKNKKSPKKTEEVTTEQKVA